MDVVNLLSEEELEKVSEMLKVSEALNSGDVNALRDDYGEEGDGEQVEFEDRDVVEELQSNVAVSLPDDQLTSVSKVTSTSKVFSLTKQL